MAVQLAPAEILIKSDRSVSSIIVGYKSRELLRKVPVPVGRDGKREMPLNHLIFPAPRPITEGNDTAIMESAASMAGAKDTSVVVKQPFASNDVGSIAAFDRELDGGRIIGCYPINPVMSAAKPGIGRFSGSGFPAFPELSGGAGLSEIDGGWKELVSTVGNEAIEEISPGLEFQEDTARSSQSGESDEEGCERDVGNKIEGKTEGYTQTHRKATLLAFGKIPSLPKFVKRKILPSVANHKANCVSFIYGKLQICNPIVGKTAGPNVRPNALD